MSTSNRLMREVCVLLVAASALTARAQETNTASLTPMIVVARDIAPTWVYGQVDQMSRALAASPQVLINSQGGYGAQNDLSIRGSSFSGAGLTIGGIALRNPQTEHFNSELPMPSSLFAPPRVLTGLDQARDTDGFLVGSISLDFAPVQQTRRVSAGVGEYSRNWESAFIQQPITSGNADAGSVGASAFGAHESADRLDFFDNDLDLWNAGGHIQYSLDDAQIDFAAGVQDKEFGARGYYGVSTNFAAEESVEDSLVLASARSGDLDGTYTRVTAQWREIDDTYDILPSIFHNQTDSRLLSASADGRQPLMDELSLNWRAGVEDETIDGISLGDHDRQRGTFTLLPAWDHGPVTLTAGARSEVFSGDSPAWLPQAGIDLRPCDKSKLYLTYTETVRQPSFTELNYESPGSLGNSGLERQESRALEAGIQRQLCARTEGHVAVFQQWTDESVDWVRKTAESTRYEAVNIDKVDALGAEVGLRGDLNDHVGLDGQYAWINKDDDADVYASRYALDYPEHLLQLSAVWRVTEALKLTGTQTLRWQTENALRTSDDFAALGSVAAHVNLPKFPQAVLTLALDNLWDDDFQVYAGQPTAGRRASAGLTLDW